MKNRGYYPQFLHEGEDSMLGFLLGCMTGGTAGIVMMCWCIAAADADRHLRK